MANNIGGERVEEQGSRQKPIEEDEPGFCRMAKPPPLSVKNYYFLNFDVVTDYSDHKFAKSKSSIVSENSAYKEIMKEWKTLNENLPPSIYLRVYENRIDLMRAAIVGVGGTPYHDGLFFFDIFFPDDYPHSAPSLRFWSYGFQLNENLPSSGSVSLSLLCMVSAKKTEAWIPGKSTIFQLLISLQALLLNEEPLYDIGEQIVRHSTDKKTKIRIEKKRIASMAYNNWVFKSSCSLMLSCMRRPPKYFEEFVTQHFRVRSRFILGACVVYMHGFGKVGDYKDPQGLIIYKKHVPVLVSFKHAMEETYSHLIVAFCKLDPSLGRFLDQLHEMVEDINKGRQNWVQKVIKILKIVISSKKKLK